MSPEQQEKFLAALRAAKSSRKACTITGIPMNAVLTLRGADVEFAREWHESFPQPEWIAAFLEHLRSSRNVYKSCAVAGISVHSVYCRRRTDAFFRSEWQAAVPPRKDWKPEFLAALRQTGGVFESCARAGISHAAVWQTRQADPEFARQWAQAAAGFNAANKRRFDLLENWKDAFLDGVRTKGTIQAGCDVANIPRWLVKRERNRNPQFEEEFQEAVQAAIDDMQSVAFDMGKKFDRGMLMFLLRYHRPEIYQRIRNETAPQEHPVPLSDDERIRKIIELLDAARTRNAGQSPQSPTPAVERPAGSADCGV